MNRANAVKVYLMTCRACDETTRVSASAGQVTRAEIVHEDACPFYLAIQAGRGPEWSEEHGYPIAWELAS
jgi:hypothetical protein